MKLSVIIPCFNGADTIGEQLTALANQKYDQPWEVIIADNGSTDTIQQVVASYRDRLPNLRIVDASQRRGAAHARNVGVREARGDFLLFCDADDVVAPGWIAALARDLEQYDIVIGCADTRKLNTSAWVVKLAQGNPNEPPRELQPEFHKAKYPPYLYMVRGWGFGARRSALDLVNGFDVELMAGQDLDFGYRAQMAGATVTVAYDAIVYYRLRDTLRQIFRQHRRYGIFTVLIYKRYQGGDFKQGALTAWLNYFRRWGGLATWLLRARDRRDLTLIIRNAGFYIGTLQGCLRYRIAPFTTDQ